MPIDFQLPPDVEEVRLRVRKFMDAEVRPAEKTLQEREADRNSYVRTIMELRTKAKGQGLWNPHLPAEWDGMGLGPVAMAFVSAEAGPHGHRAVRDQRPGAGRRQHAHAPALGDARAEGAVPAPAGRRPRALLLRDDGAGSRRVRPNADPDEGGERRRRLGDQRPQVVHLRRQGCLVRHPHRLHGR